MPPQPPDDVAAAPSRWIAVRCIFRFDEPLNVYEERVTLWWAVDVAEAFRRAEEEAEAYAHENTARYLGLAQSYLPTGPPVDGAEVFSLMRRSDLPDEAYLATFFATGDERQRAFREPPADLGRGMPSAPTTQVDADATADRGSWAMEHFSQSNPDGDSRASVPALLRRVAESIESLGEVEIQDIVLHRNPDLDGEDYPFLTVYLYRP